MKTPIHTRLAFFVGGLAVGALGLHAVSLAHSGVAHLHGALDAGSPGLSITGSPAELADRAGQMARHVCAVLATTPCAFDDLAATAATDLQSQQAAYAEGLNELHRQLTAAAHDSTEVERLAAAQAQRVQVASARYLRLIAEGSATLSGEQRQRFAGGTPTNR